MRVVTCACSLCCQALCFGVAGQLASGAFDSTVRLWDVANATCIFVGHSSLFSTFYLKINVGTTRSQEQHIDTAILTERPSSCVVLMGQADYLLGHGDRPGAHCMHFILSTGTHPIVADEAEDPGSSQLDSRMRLLAGLRDNDGICGITS